MPNENLTPEKIKELLSRANDLRWRSNAGALEERIEIHSRLLDALPALLDRIEELEKEVIDLKAQRMRLYNSWTKENRDERDRAQTAETELSALKAKMEKVRDKALEWQAGPNVDYDWCGGRILAVLDGKQQQSAAEQQFYTLGGVYVDREPPFACWKATDGIHYQTPEQANAAMSSMGRRGRVRYTKADFDRETIQAAFDDAVKAQAAYWQKVTQLERLLYDDFELDLEGLRGDACDLECSYDVDGLIAQAIEDLSDADDDGDPQ